MLILVWNERKSSKSVPSSKSVSQIVSLAEIALTAVAEIAPENVPIMKPLIVSSGVLQESLRVDQQAGTRRFVTTWESPITL